MDNRGYWHETEKGARDANREYLRQSRTPVTEERIRPVISIEEGETVTVMKSDGTFIRCRFEAAEKNKVWVRPIELNPHQPCVSMSENVTLERENGEQVSAQIWDNRRGRIVLRTLAI